MLTVQYTEGQVKSISDLRAIPLRASASLLANAPGHYQLDKPKPRLPKWITTRSVVSWTSMFAHWERNWEALPIASTILSRKTKIPEGLNVTLRGWYRACVHRSAVRHRADSRRGIALFNPGSSIP